MCECVNAIPLACLMERCKISRTFAECIGECQCRCHFDEHGAILTNEAWPIHKQQLEIQEEVRQQRLEDARIIRQEKLAVQVLRRVRLEKLKRPFPV